MLRIVLPGCKGSFELCVNLLRFIRDQTSEAVNCWYHPFMRKPVVLNLRVEARNALNQSNSSLSYVVEQALQLLGIDAHPVAKLRGGQTPGDTLLRVWLPQHQESLENKFSISWRKPIKAAGL